MSIGVGSMQNTTDFGTNERAQNIVGDNNFHLGVNYTT